MESGALTRANSGSVVKEARFSQSSPQRVAVRGWPRVGRFQALWSHETSASEGGVTPALWWANENGCTLTFIAHERSPYLYCTASLQNVYPNRVTVFGAAVWAKVR